MQRFIVTLSFVLLFIISVLAYSSTLMLGNWGLSLPSHPNDTHAYVETRRIETGVPGMAVGIFDKNGLQWESYHGTANGSDPVTEDTIFMVASVSKTVVGTAAFIRYLSFENRQEVKRSLSV